MSSRAGDVVSSGSKAFGGKRSGVRSPEPTKSRVRQQSLSSQIWGGGGRDMAEAQAWPVQLN